MESLFHVRYWDYSKQPLNLHGYICALSAATWAVFSVLIVSVVNPLVKPFVYKIPLNMADIASVVLVSLCGTGYGICRAPCARFARPAGIYGTLREGTSGAAWRSGTASAIVSAA